MYVVEFKYFEEKKVLIEKFIDVNEKFVFVFVDIIIKDYFIKLYIKVVEEVIIGIIFFLVLLLF